MQLLPSILAITLLFTAAQAQNRLPAPICPKWTKVHGKYASCGQCSPTLGRCMAGDTPWSMCHPDTPCIRGKLFCKTVRDIQWSYCSVDPSDNRTLLNPYQTDKNPFREVLGKRRLPVESDVEETFDSEGFAEEEEEDEEEEELVD
ncbi:hypothetical protein CkaCkLH20_12292 [Colletotrichum karsti]|uniref:Uncharacterized protein n=1 Tax=Colletotrichum karsti TaxID=1095194 RepID=A0A9P6HWG8_9PEZI|nr:uncharacterized protein CkaCkLH20_12292 [Colletotrichum karsti]KAF9870206.1 hypothetical protein CkaCkLH20_12292 [Colletotrichum karsti]